MELLIDSDTQTEADDLMAVAARKEVRFRKRSELNMWIVILTIFVIDVY